MNFRDYLTVARTLAGGATEAEWRSASSRAYYAAFHVARLLLLDLGFRVPQAERARGYLWPRVSNAGHADTVTAGRRFGQLRRERNWADYDDRRVITQTGAVQNVQEGEEIIQALDAAAVEPVRTQIIDAMKIHERDVLKDVTWHP
jgi:uncharacterized protein (UPF0332 family)